MSDERVAVQKICATCAAFVAPEAGAEAIEYDGWCRCYPPTVMAIAPTANTTSWTPQSFWPEVKSDDWCLQWAAKP